MIYISQNIKVTLAHIFLLIVIASYNYKSRFVECFILILNLFSNTNDNALTRIYMSSKNVPKLDQLVIEI